MGDNISRQAVKELAHKQVREKYCGMAFKKHRDFYIKLADNIIDLLPSAEPQIIYCKDCVKHNRRIGDFKEMPNGEVIWYWKYNACSLAEFRGKAQGHEFDYQFCAYAERREVTT